ncbi:kinesin-like protein KIFC3 [Tubulanus polymorphus]|uniref:kinesin-like protein KIFC3 n=1 Tax=Tubulanus polymorphus TaxID=672921 RepID=UPI003DA60837
MAKVKAVFKTPMVFTPREGAKPSPSRAEIWREQLGLDADELIEDVNGSKEDLAEEPQKIDELTMIEYHAIQRELIERNAQRDDLLFRIKTLTDKCKQYKQKLTREEFTKKQQIKIMRKSHEVNLEEKQGMIAHLEELLEEQETKIGELEKQLTQSSKSGRECPIVRTPSGHTQLLQQLKRLQQEKADMTGKLMASQAQTEYIRNEYNNEIVKLRESITLLEKVKNDLQEEIISLRNVQGIANTDTEKALKKLEEENDRLEMENYRLQKICQESIKSDEHQHLLDVKEDLKSRVDQLDEELQVKSKKISHLESEHQFKVQKLQEENKAIAMNLNSMMTELTTLQSRKPEVITKIERVEVESTADKQALSEARKEIIEMNKRLRNMQEACVSSKSQLVNAVNRCKELELKVTEAEEQCISAEAQLQRQFHKVEAQKQATVQAIKQQAEKKLIFAYNNLAVMREKVTCLYPIIREILMEQKKLKDDCQALPKFVSAAVKNTSQHITRLISGVDDKNKELVQKYRKEMALRKKYHNQLVELKGNIRVFTRVRPKIREDGGGIMATNCLSYDEDDNALLNVQFKGRRQVFEMDRVFTDKSSQPEVFEEVKPLVISAIDGYNVCIFAYGQTGSGKTYTMEGPNDDPGINQRALIELFNEMEERSTDWVYSINVSVMEIYNEMIRDLLSNDPLRKLDVKMNQDSSLYVPGLTSIEVSNVSEVNKTFTVGRMNRVTASTNMNEHSSRSHALLTINVLGTNKTTGVRTLGKLNLVDLAGSERVSKSGADGARLKEAQNINKSLSSLGDVIHALKNKQSHIPYRNSKLTYLLQDSLGGESKTLMIVQIAPVEKNVNETLCSLNFGQRARTVELGTATKKAVKL